MRLLQCILNRDDDSVDIRLREYSGDERPEYAILSHRWREEEVEYQHMMSQPDFRRMRGYAKIEGCARAALRYGIEHIWIDTCNINKASSAELSEALNCMYEWYNDSLMCFAFLDDVSSSEEGVNLSEIRASKWFTRGWTLQELIAPKTMMFYSRDWTKLGSRMDLANTISVATGIDIRILQNTRHLDSASVAEKMSWAADRQTTRVEDVAYSLMGLFGVNMPTLYGEGNRAFRRLQLEIMQTSNDHTLFAWQDTSSNGDMLASSPRQFKESHRFQPIPYTEYISRFSIRSPKPDYTMTNAGLHIQLPMIPNPKRKDGFIAFLACTRVDQLNRIFGKQGTLLADPLNRIFAVLYLERTEDSSFHGFHRTAFQGRTVDEVTNPPPGMYESLPVWVSTKAVHVARPDAVPSRILTPSTFGGSGLMEKERERAGKRRSGIVNALRRRSTMRIGKKTGGVFGGEKA